MRQVSTFLFLWMFGVIALAQETGTIPWSEDFSELANGEVPEGWKGDATNNWGVFGAANAGGTSPEMVFWWQPEGEGTYDLSTPTIKTSGYTELQFSFKHRIRNFGDPGLYTLSVKALSGGTVFPIAEWVDPGTMAAEELTFILTAADHKVGSDDFQIIWTFEGPTNNITQWDIDDISLTEVGAEGVLQISPAAHVFDDQQIGTSSEVQVFTLENTGSAALDISPEQISLRATDAQSTDFKLMTYNIWFDSQNWPARLNYMLSEIREINPDVICLQEVIQRTNLPNQAATLADSLGYFYVFASVDGPGSATRFGNAILSRYPIVEDNWVALKPLNDFRTALHARIEVAGNDIDIYNTHLHNTAVGVNIRTEQITDLLAFVEETQLEGPGYQFLCGDFNSNPDWEEMQLVYEVFEDVYPIFHPDHLDPIHGTLNFNLEHQQRRIDYVFFKREGSERIKPQSASIEIDEQSPTGIWGSDHFAVVGDFRIESDADDFVLTNLEESVSLQPGETVGISVAFAPKTIGEKSAFLIVDTLEVAISGLAFDATVRSFPYQENFDGLSNGTLPQGWNRTSNNWGAFGANTAGGEAPEMNFWWQPVSSGTFVLSSPFIDTEGLDSMELSYKYRVNDFGDPGIYTLKVAVVTEADTIVLEEWVDPATIEPTEFAMKLYSGEHGVGEGLVRLAWIFEGQTDNIVQWDFDDVLLEALPALSISPEISEFGIQEINEFSDPRVFELRNVGGGIIDITPEDISIEGDGATDFVLLNLVEAVSLEGELIASISVVFAPETEGVKTATLQVLDQEIPLSGEGFDPAIRELPWSEGFDGLAGGGIPIGWASDAENWGAFNANNAGGEAPEMVFWWQPESSGQFYLVSPRVLTGDADSLAFSFKYRIRNFGSPGIYTLKAVTISEGIERVIGEWVNPDFVAATEFSTILTQEDHALGADDLRFAWIFDGQTDNITEWDIDDILLDTLVLDPILQVAPETIDFGIIEGESASAPRDIVISNVGGGALLVGPDDIVLSGANPEDFVLDNLTEEVSLGAFESISIQVAFVPQSLGNKSANVSILDEEVGLTGNAVEPSPYFVYSDFTIVENGREFTNVGGFREVAGFSAGNLTALDKSGEGDFGNVVVELDYDMSLSESRTVYYMWAFPNVDLSEHNRMVIYARAESAATSVKINLQDTDGINASDGGSETFIDIGTDWTLVDFPVSEMALASWATNPPDMTRIQKVDMEFVRDVTEPESNTVFLDLVGFYFDESVATEEEKLQASNFSILPNPAGSTLMVRLEQDSKVSIITLTGQTILEQSMSTGETALDISKLPAGVYFVKATKGNKQSVRKLIKE